MKGKNHIDVSDIRVEMNVFYQKMIVFVDFSAVNGPRIQETSQAYEKIFVEIMETIDALALLATHLPLCRRNIPSNTRWAHFLMTSNQ